MSFARLWTAFARLPAAGFALPLIVTLTLWRANTDRLAYEDALPALAIMLGITLVLFVALRLALRSWRRAALVTTIWMAFALYAPRAVGMVVENPWLRGIPLLIGALFAWDVSRRVPKEEAELGSLNGLANLLLVLRALGLAGLVAIEQVRAERTRPGPATVFRSFEGEATAASPDVWHLLFDRYASSDTLRRVYHFDNAPFLNALRARGFEVGENVYSNYPRTAHSVASTLNASYLDPLAPIARSDDWVPLYRTMTDSAALRFFNAQGYRTIFSGSWWNPTRRSAGADLNVNYRDLPELGRLLVGQSIVGYLLARLGLPYGDGREDQCRRAQAKFRDLARLAADPDRKYIFGHFLIPHPPFVTDADGGCRSLEVARAASRRDNYVAQTVYANREILKLVDAILAGPRPATIVIHSDEGPWPIPYVGDEHRIGGDPVPVEWSDLSPGQLREKMGIMLAVRFADGKPRGLPGSPVNIYPLVLRENFGGSRPPLPDRNFVYRHSSLYSFKDVSATFD